LDADDRDAVGRPCDLPGEVRERGGPLAVARTGDALAAVFNGADAPVTRGQQGAARGVAL